jgi:signal peptidase I
VTNATPTPTATRTTWQVVDTLQAIITALTLAFIFRAFFVEQFIIPTGSMAESLLGAHTTMVCPACGWEYAVAPRRTRDGRLDGFDPPDDVVCPNCHLRLLVTEEDAVATAGDRILVSKWPYALGGLFGPRRWDVIVFRDPTSVDQHYIKRLVGLPNETLEIVDGDLFVDGRVARKPKWVQERLWFVVFDQSHVPSGEAASGTMARWIAHDPPPADGGGWTGLKRRVLHYDGMDDTPRKLSFNADTGRGYLADFYGYNRRSSGALVGDVRLCTDVQFEAASGWLELAIVHPPHRFEGRLERTGADGLLTLRMWDADRIRLVREWKATVSEDVLRRRVALVIRHLDRRVYVSLDGRDRLWTTDDAYGTDLEALREFAGDRPVGLSITAARTRLALERVRIDRDVHYTRNIHSRRAYAGRPFRLEAGEYFVLGDNSPDSHDSREWTDVGRHLGADARVGVVRADQIVGQAGFVYLPGLLTPQLLGGWQVPDLGRVRLVR